MGEVLTPEGTLQQSSLAIDLQGKTYGCIMADPPWHFRSWSAKGTGRSAEQHYAVMNLEDIKSLDVSAIAARDACLFLWAVDCMLPEALETMAAWGFTFKTVAFDWIKQTTNGKWHIGLGYWTRMGSERVLLGTRGKPKPLSHAVRQVVIAKRREHSRKPDEVRGRIEQLVAGPRLELFAREAAIGWDSWGNEVGKWKSNLLTETSPCA